MLNIVPGTETVIIYKSDIAPASWRLHSGTEDEGYKPNRKEGKKSKCSDDKL